MDEVFCWSGGAAPRPHALWVSVTMSCVDRCACEYISSQEGVVRPVCLRHLHCGPASWALQ